MADGYKWIAVQVLAGSALTPVERVDNLDTAAQLLTELHNSGSLQVISEVAQGPNSPDIRTIMDLAPGGLDFLDSIGVAELRMQLSRILSNREILGHPLLVGKLDEKYKTDILANVNSVLFGLDQNATSMIPAIIYSDLTAEERDAVTEVQTRACGLFQVGALWAPTPERFATAVVNYADKALHKLPQEQADFLQALVDATATLRQKGQGSRSYVESRRLAVLAYEYALELTNLAASCFTGEENAQRISDALGGTVTKDVVEPLQQHLPYGIQVIAPSGPRSYSSRKPDIEDITVKEAVKIIDSLIDGDVLPTRIALGEYAPRIEAAYGKPWNEIADAMVKFQRYRRPSSSANEVYLKELVDEAFIGQIDDIEMEWTDADLMGKQRADVYVALNDELGGEILFEADGQGHFEEIANWDLPRAQSGDRTKNDAVISAAESGRTVSMVALHHDLLTGKAEYLIDANSLKNIAETVRTRELSCVFIRRNGSEQMRSTSGTSRKLRIKGLSNKFEAFALS